MPREHESEEPAQVALPAPGPAVQSPAAGIFLDVLNIFLFFLRIFGGRN